jgi:hypothetical protein
VNNNRNRKKGSQRRNTQILVEAIFVLDDLGGNFLEVFVQIGNETGMGEDGVEDTITRNGLTLQLGLKKKKKKVPTERKGGRMSGRYKKRRSRGEQTCNKRKRPKLRGSFLKEAASWWNSSVGLFMK